MLRRAQLFDGWIVVGAVFVLLMANAGLGFYGLSVFLRAITDEQGLSVSAVSFATSIFFVVSALAGRMIAPVIEVRDLRLVVGAGGVIGAVGVWLISQSTQLLTLYPSYVVFAVGIGLSGLVPATTLVTRWFHARRSVALSIASTGLSAGALTVTVVVSRLIDSKGMAGAGLWLGALYLGMVAVSLLGLWPDPHRRGLVPDGINYKGSLKAADVGVDYDTAVGSHFFRWVTLAFVATMGAQVGGISQIVKLGTDRVDATTGTLAVSAIAFASVVARLVGGVVASRVRLISMTAVLAGVQALSLFALSQANSKAMLVASALLFGCTIGNLLMLQPLLIANRFGVISYPRIFAISQLIVVGFGVAVGPYLLGVLRDLFNYEVSYVVAAAMSSTGALLFWVGSSDD